MPDYVDPEHVQDARILAGRGIQAGTSGVYRSDGTPVAAALVFNGTRRLHGHATPERVAMVKRRMAGEFAYGGPIVGQFGHLMLETFARLSTFTQCDLPVMFSDLGLPNQQMFWSMVDAMGLPRERIVLVQSPVIVERLRIVPPDFRIRASITLPFIESYAAIGAQVAARTGARENSNSVPVYLSRSKVALSGRHYFGETLIEAILKRHGVDIVHPEELSFEEQIVLWLTRRTIGGFAGSAFHPLLFARRPKTLTYLTTRKINPNFRLIESLKENDSRFLRLPSDPAADATGLKGPFLVSREGIVEACRAMGLAVTLDDVPDADYAACRDAYGATVAALPG